MSGNKRARTAKMGMLNIIIPIKKSITIEVRIYKYEGEVKDFFSTLSKWSESNGSTGFQNISGNAG